jgi:hypothetical protein
MDRPSSSNDVHVTRYGTQMLISEMSDSHLCNHIAFLERRAEELSGAQVWEFTLNFEESYPLYLDEGDLLKAWNYQAYVLERDWRTAHKLANPKTLFPSNYQFSNPLLS